MVEAWPEMASPGNVVRNTDDGGGQARIKSPNQTVRYNELDEPSNSSAAPCHPLRFMQAPFEESIIDSSMPRPDRVKERLSAEARRQQMLDLDDEQEAFSSRWTQLPGAKFHPLWKLIAQISFGVHLLHKNLAKSEEEVIRILQKHVDEVDSFAEDTSADFDLAIKDIQDRIQNLLLPLEHSRTFNNMLCDKNFRTSILEGNDVIERVIRRTRSAADYALNDVAKGLEAVVELAKYLDRLWADWPNRHHELIDAYHVMRGNAEGWYRAFRRCQQKGDHLSDVLVKLESVVDEVTLRAGIASRRKTPTGLVGRKKQQMMTSEAGSQRSSSVSSVDRRQSIDKPLPAPPSRRHSLSPHKLPATGPHLHVHHLSVSTTESQRSDDSRMEFPSPPKRSIATPQRQCSPVTSESHRQSYMDPGRRNPSPAQTSRYRPPAVEPVGRTSNLSNPAQNCSPVESLPSATATADSGYSSCPDTPPTLSPQNIEHIPVRSLSVASTVATLSPQTPQTPQKHHPIHPLEELCEEMSDFVMSQPRRRSGELVTALPIFKATPAFMYESKKHTVLKKTSGPMRSLFAKKPVRRDVSGGVGGCVIIT